MGDIIKGNVKKISSGEKPFSAKTIILANGVKLEFLPEDYPCYIDAGDCVEIDYREEFGGSKEGPRVKISRPGFSNNPIYASNLPAGNIS